MKRLLTLFALATTTFHIATAQEATDTTEVKSIQEVTVTAQNHVAIQDGIAYTPTPEERRLSSNAVSLLARMMVAGLRVDEFSGTVETSWGKGVSFFIDGAEAQDWEVKAIRPKEVARVEYLQSPSDPRFRGASSVVNFVMRQYAYGGYVVLNGQQSFVNEFGDYSVATKYKRGKTTFLAMLDGFYRNAEDCKSWQDVTYRYNDGHAAQRSVRSVNDFEQQAYTGGISLRHDTQRFVWIAQAGLKHSRKPHDHTESTVSMVEGQSAWQSDATTDGTSRSLLPYASFTGYLLGLPRNAYMYGGASFSYNYNRAESQYLLASADAVPLLNGYKERAFLPNVWLGYNMLAHKKARAIFVVDYTPEVYLTDYLGSAASHQRLTNSYLTLTARYDHYFSNKWKGTLKAIVPVETYKVNHDASHTTVFINGAFSLSGQISPKHSIYAEAKITQSEVIPSYYNTVVRQDNDAEGSRGNADLKTVRQAFALLSYTWMPVNSFSLNAAVTWDNIIHDIVPYWHEENGLMVREMVNSGDYNPLYISLSPSASFFKGKLRLQSKFSYNQEWHSGLYHVNNKYFGIYPSVFWSISNNWSANAGFNWSSGKAYMRGGSQMGRFVSTMNVGVQYAKGNLYLKAQVCSVFRKNGWVKNWLTSSNIDSYTYLSRPWDGRYITLSATYTIDYGKKLQHGDDMSFGGTSKSSAL